MKGLDAAKTFHDENSGLPYIAFKIEENSKPPNDAKQVRVLALTNDDEDRPDMPVIQSLVMHQKFKVLNSTRCLAGDSLKPVPELCPLCRVKAPRTLRTYIPVRVRNTKADEVQIIEYGRNNVQEVAAMLSEIEGGDITSCDFKIKRIGTKVNTKYKWFIVKNTDRPLNDEELALEVPDVSELIPLKELHEVEAKAMEWQRAAGAKKTGGTNDNDETPEDDAADGSVFDDIPF